MKKILFALLLLISTLGFSQTQPPYNPKINSSNWYIRIKADTFHIPVRNCLCSDSKDSSAELFVYSTDSSLYLHYLRQFLKIGGSGGGVIDTTSLSDRINKRLLIADTIGNYTLYAFDGRSASGDLSGNYPNPTVAQFNGQLPAYYLNYLNLTNKPTIPTIINLVDTAYAINDSTVTVHRQGGVTWNIKIRGIGGSGSAITSLIGDGTASGPGAASFTLSVVNSTSGAHGDSSSTLVLTYDSKGRVSGAVVKSILIGESQVTDLVADLAGKQASLGFTPENIANKTATASTSTTTYPNWAGVENYAVSLAQRITDSTNIANALAGKVSLTKYQTDSIANVANLAAKVAYSKYQTDSTAQAAINTALQSGKIDSVSFSLTADSMYTYKNGVRKGYLYYIGNAATVTTNANLTGDVTSTGNATTYNNTVPINKGGTGTTTPGIVAGTNVTVTGSWPNQTVNASGGTLNNNYTYPLATRVTGSYAITNHELVLQRSSISVTDTLPLLSTISDTASITVRWDSGSVANLMRVITRGGDVINVSSVADTFRVVGEVKTYQGKKSTGIWTVINGNLPSNAVVFKKDTIPGSATYVTPTQLANIVQDSALTYNNKIKRINFDPSKISSVDSLIIWIKADDFSTVTLDGSGNVSQINDKSGRGNNLTQATSGNRPVYQYSGGANNRSYIQMAANKTLSNALVVVTNPCTIFYVTKQTSIADFATILELGTSSNGIAQRVAGSGAFANFSTTCNVQGTTYEPINTPYSYKPSQYQAFMLIRDSINSDLSQNGEPHLGGYYMGGLCTPGQTAYGGTAPISKVILGSDNVQASQNFEELLIFKGKLSQFDQNTVWDYLQNNWNTVPNDYITWFGNSITRGANATLPDSNSYSAIVSIEKNKDCYNYGASGTTVYQPNIQAHNNFNETVNFLTNANNGWFVWEYAENDNVDATDSALWTSISKSLIQKATSIGYNKGKVILCSPRYNTHDSARSLIVRDCVNRIATQLGVVYFDGYTYTQMNGGQSLIDPADNIHLNNLGHRVWANGLETIIQ